MASYSKTNRNQGRTAKPKIPVSAQVLALFAWIVWIFGVIEVYGLRYMFDGVALIIAFAVVIAVGCILMGFSTVICLLAEIAWNTRPKD